jgi:hypothetical protein
VTARTRLLKKILLSLIVVGALGSVTVQRTYALFSVEQTNAGQSVSSGTLTLQTTIGAATCKSLNDNSPATNPNVNTSCTALFPGTQLEFPGVPDTVHVTVTNTGSVDAQALELWMATCTNVNTPGVTIHNGGNACASGGGAQMYIQETDSLFTTMVKCWYPNTNTGACGAFGDVGTFQLAFHAYPGKKLWIPTTAPIGTALPAAATSPQPSLNSRYFIIGMQLPANASNTLQGQSPAFPLTWHIED